MTDYDSIRNTLSTAKLCQRNWSDKSVAAQDIEFFKSVITENPKKQGQIFHHTLFIENKSVINDIYYNAKAEDERIPHNGQMSAPLLIMFVPYDTAILARFEQQITHNFNQANHDKTAYSFTDRDINVSIGIHSGILTFVANQLGYRTGFCSCFNSYAKQIIKDLCKDSIREPYFNYDEIIAIGIGHDEESVPHNYDRTHDTVMYRHTNEWNELLHFSHIK